MQVDGATKLLKRVPSTPAPTDLSTWVAGSDYRAGDGAAFTPSGVVGDLTLNSLGLFSTGNFTLPIGSANTLTLTSGGLAWYCTGNQTLTLTNGSLTTPAAELYIQSGNFSGFNSTLDIASELKGAMDVIKAGILDVRFSGSDANTYSGTTYVINGNLDLRKVGSAVAIPGDLVIRHGASVLVGYQGTQLSPTTEVTVEDGGLLVLNSGGPYTGLMTLQGGRMMVLDVSPTLVGGVAFDGGRIRGNASPPARTLSLQGPVTYAATSTDQARWENIVANPLSLELDGTNRTFNIADSSYLAPGVPEMVVNLPIVNGSGSAAESGITKTGAGTLQFVTTNTYSGPTIIQQGTLHVATQTGPALSGLRASIHTNASGPNQSTIIFHAPIATNLVQGQLLSGGGVISTNCRVVDVIDAYEIRANTYGASTDSVDMAVAALSISGSLGSGPVTNNGGTLLVDAGISLANTIYLNGGTITNHGTFTGGLTINGGVLTGTGTNSGAATLYGGVILSTLSGPTTVNGSISPAGQATGTLNVANNVTWNSGDSWSSANDWYFQLGPNNTSDLLNITGHFNNGAGTAYRFDFGGSTNTGTFKLVDWTETTDFQPSDFSYVNLGGGSAATFQFNDSQLEVVIASCTTPPTITLGASPTICQGTTSTNLTYSGTTGSPDKYSIDYSDTANLAGFADVLPTSLGASPLVLTIPGSPPAGVYTGVLSAIKSADGCRSQTNFTVTVNAIPATPASIAGSATVCSGSAGVSYSIAAVPSASGYAWSVPSGATITNGQGTTQIFVNWGGTAGNVSVIASNACGASSARTLAVAVLTAVPGAPTAAAASEVSLNSFLANWSAGSGTIAGYRLDVANSIDFTSGYVVSNLALSASTIFYELTGLESGETYYYRVRAYNACGDSTNSATISVLTPLILAAWDVSGLAGGSGSYGASPLAATTYATGQVTVAGLERGPGVTQSGTAAASGWGGTAWNSASAAAAISAGQFATCVVQAVSGRTVSFISIAKLDYRRPSGGPTQGVLQYSVNGSDYYDIVTNSYSITSDSGGSIAVPIILTNIVALQGVTAGTPVTLRFVNYGASGATEPWYIYDTAKSSGHDLEIRGVVCEAPVAYNVTGGGAYCSGGGGATVVLANSQLRVTYQLYRANGGSPIAVGSPKAGTGGSLSFVSNTVADTYTVVATRNSGGCSANMTGSAVVTITTTPGAPTDLEATPSSGNVALEWAAPIGYTVTGYNVKRSAASGGPYATVSGGANVPGLTFNDSSALDGNTYYYVVTALNDGCEGMASDEVEAIMPSNCPPGIPPTMPSPGNRTVTIGNNLSISVTADDSSAICDSPTMSHSQLPAFVGVTTNTGSGSSTLNFTGTPISGQQGSYPITVTATDSDLLSTSVTFVVFVGNFGESGNGGSAPPNSQTNWSVAITNLIVPSSGNATVVWTSVDGVQYDVLSSALPVGGGASWSNEGATVEAEGSLSTAAVVNSGTRYYHVVPAGTPATGRGVWGVVRPAIPAGFSMFAPPLESDLKLNGSLGTNLAAVLPQNTQIYIMAPGLEGTWKTLYRDANGHWIDQDTSQPYTTALNAGQGFFIGNPGASAVIPTFSGPVGNDGTSQNLIKQGFNIVGVSEGKGLPAGTAFSDSSMTADPVGSYNDETADQIVLLDTSGAWRRLIRRPTTPPTWYDTATRGTTSLILMPGQAYYYIRRNSDSTVSF
jgi:autotransporter-associated beta strand protein